MRMCVIATVYWEGNDITACSSAAESPSDSIYLVVYASNIDNIIVMV